MCVITSELTLPYGEDPLNRTLLMAINQNKQAEEAESEPEPYLLIKNNRWSE